MGLAESTDAVNVVVVRTNIKKHDLLIDTEWNELIHQEF